MKRYLALLTLFLVGVGVAAAAITADTDLAAGKTTLGTFSNPQAATDGAIDRGQTAVSGDLTRDPQFLTIDLGGPAYIQRVKIFWDKDRYSKEYEVRVSRDAKSWETELAKADAATGVTDDRAGTISQVITGKRFTSANRYVQIYIPLGSKATSSTLGVTEVQIFPATGQKIAISNVSAYVVTNRSAIVTVKSNLGATSGSVVYGQTPDNLDQQAAITDLGEVTSAAISGLQAGRTYFYKARVWDAYGNMAESAVKQFAPSKDNIALGKKVLGTFTNLPKDPYVDTKKDVLTRLTDGGTSYFTSMATSGSLKNGDQYVIIDLGKPYPIDQVLTYWRNLAYPKDFRIVVSNDNNEFFDGVERLDAGNGAFTRSDAGDPMRVVKSTLEGVTARYVKVLIAQGSPCFQKHADWDFVQLMEVEVLPK